MASRFPHLANLQAALSQHNVQLGEQALIEISGLTPAHQFFLIGTSNDLSRVGSRLLRGGRFSETIEIGLPDEVGLRRLIARHLGNIRLDADLSADALAKRLAGMPPAEVESVATAARRLTLCRLGTAELPRN